MRSDSESLTFGDEEGDFYIHQTHRTKPFERTKHYHSTYEIYYLLSGQRAYFIKDKSYRIFAGDLIFINKYDLHKSSGFGEPAHERIVINFSDAFLGTGHPLDHPALLRVFQQPFHLLRLKPHDQSFAENLMNKLTKEVIRKDLGYESYIRLLLIELLLFAARRIEQNDAIQNEHEHPSPMHKKITAIVKHINLHFHDHLSLTGLSDTFRMSPYYLSRTFKAVTGFTFIEYVNLTRIKEAQRLLKETDRKIIDIAEAVGFDNIGHFDRVFKKMTTMNPLTYRKMHMD